MGMSDTKLTGGGNPFPLMFDLSNYAVSAAHCAKKDIAQ